MIKIFYIAPYYFDSEFYTKFKAIEEITKDNKIKILRAVKTEGKDFDIDKTMKLYSEADYFIADLSFERPSCYYEAGYIQGMKKELFLIAAKGTRIHQVKGEVNFYSNFNEYKVIIKEIIKEIKKKNSYERN